MTYIDMNGLASPMESWIFYLILSIGLVVVLGFYLLRSFGLYALAKRHGENKGAWTAFCPIIWVYIASKLAGEVAIFGKKIKSFAVVILIVACIAEGLVLLINAFQYVPLVGYVLQGGELLISSTAEYFPIGSWYLPTSLFYICMPNIVFPYSDGLWTALNVISTVQSIVAIVYLVFTVFMYSAFFKTYLPAHSLVATIFSVLGLFPPFAFAVRKNDKTDYNQYMRAQYTAFYGVPPHGANPYSGQQGGYYGRGDVAGDNEPFGEFEDKEKEPFGEFKDDDPFGEFEDKGDK